MRTLLNILLFFGLTSAIFTQNNINYERYISDTTATGKDSTNKLRWDVLAPVGAVVAGLNIYLYTGYKDEFYKEKMVKFHTHNDWDNADMNMDKLGHLFVGKGMSALSYDFYKQSGVSDSWNFFLAPATSLLFMMQIEYHDAYFDAWGWSWWDVGCNVLGAFYPNLQRAWKPLNAVNLKLSYWPSDAYNKGWYDYYVKDYEGMTFWLTFNVHSFLPEKAEKYWPDWLNLAVGYGADKIKLDKIRYNAAPEGPLGDREYYLALDYDLVKLFKPKSEFLRSVLEFLNNFHLPAPGIKFTPKPQFYFLLFSQ